MTSAPGSAAREVAIPVNGASLPGDLVVPARSAGLVIFAHGSGSGRRSPRNRQVAAELNAAGIATLLFDLLTPAEGLDRANVFDVDLLSGRLAAVTDWVRRDPGCAGLEIGYFGASTGGAAAIWAAAEPGAEIRALVSRGGRPDLALPRLQLVRAPTLLIVGGLDLEVLELNRRAQARLAAPSALEVVPGASHLFEEPGTLERVAILARDWFLRWLSGPGSR